MHVMLDLETMGTRPGCVVLSIGAVAYDLGGNIHDDFYRTIDSHSCALAGLAVERGTYDWWQRQDAASRRALTINPRPLPEVARDFNNWWRDCGGRFVWSQGATFDPPIWEAAMAAVDMRAPWAFTRVHDTRTAYTLANFDPRSLDRVGVHHNALDDARHQVACVHRAIAMLRGSHMAMSAA